MFKKSSKLPLIALEQHQMYLSLLNCFRMIFSSGHNCTRNEKQLSARIEPGAIPIKKIQELIYSVLKFKYFHRLKMVT